MLKLSTNVMLTVRDEICETDLMMDCDSDLLGLMPPLSSGQDAFGANFGNYFELVMR